MRRLLLPVVVAAWPVAAGASAATTHDVAIKDNAYQPASITVAVGDTVQWTNGDVAQHTVTFTGESGQPHLLVGQTSRRSFDTAGTYQYHCEIHSFMHGTVVAQGGSTSTTARSTSTTEPPEGSARTGTPEESTTTSSSTTTIVASEDDSTTTTTSEAGSGGVASGVPRPPTDHHNTDVGGPAAAAAVLLLGTGGAAFYATRTSPA